jgi:hypothetical protein
MSSPHLTGRKSEILLALPVIEELAEETLTPLELEEAERISLLFVGSKGQKRVAIYELMKMVEPPPKRPIYYAQMELRCLPTYTRNAIRYLGDYVDLLVKAFAFEITRDKHCKSRSLGVNVKTLSSKKYGVPIELLDKLKKYNSFLYQPGKHDFTLPPGRSHRFTCKEVVYTAFVTMKLADEIKKLSQFATKISLNQAELEDLQ